MNGENSGKMKFMASIKDKINKGIKGIKGISNTKMMRLNVKSP